MRSLAEFITDTLKASLDIAAPIYDGDLDIGISWAFTFHRDEGSTVLEISNFEVIYHNLLKRFPEDVLVLPCPHPACDRLDLLVRMLDDESEVTGGAEALYEWVQRLNDWPVADDVDLERRDRDLTE